MSNGTGTNKNSTGLVRVRVQTRDELQANKGSGRSDGMLISMETRESIHRTALTSTRTASQKSESDRSVK
jgi:hypothetical protein